jgi:hypothetical protein
MTDIWVTVGVSEWLIESSIKKLECFDHFWGWWGWGEVGVGMGVMGGVGDLS